MDYKDFVKDIRSINGPDISPEKTFAGITGNPGRVRRSDITISIMSAAAAVAIAAVLPGGDMHGTEDDGGISPYNPARTIAYRSKEIRLPAITKEQVARIYDAYRFPQQKKSQLKRKYHENNL